MRHNTIKIFLIIAALILCYVYAGSIFTLASHRMNTDIMLSYLSGKMLNMHALGYHFSSTYVAEHQLKSSIIPNLSPPFSVMMTSLATRYISYQSFFITFMVSALFVNAWALTRLYQHFYEKKDQKKYLILSTFILANLFYWPSFMNTTFGQVALALNALVIFCYLSLEKKYFIRAGFFLAIAINIKLFFGIFFVYFIAKKQYKAFFAFLLCSALLATIPLCFYGKSIYQGYFEALNYVQWYGVNWNASWYGFFARLFGETSHPFYSIFFFPKLSKGLFYCFFLFYIVFIYYFSRKHPHSPLTFAFTLSSMLLISPLGWCYYFPILITAFIINIIAAESRDHYILFTCLLLLALFLSALPFPLYRNSSTTAIMLTSKGNLFFLSLLLLNTINFLQLLIAHKKNKTLILTHKFKVIIFSICLLPSVIGIGDVIFLLAQGQTTEQEAPRLATLQDLSPFNPE